MTAPDWREELGAAIGYTEAYVERKIQIAKLDAAEKAAKTGAGLATGLVLLLLFPVVLTTLSIGLGFLLSSWLEVSVGAGFLILSGIYSILGVVLYSFRKHLFTNPILSKIVKEIFKD